MGQTKRNSKIGCATRVESKKAKYPQTLLLKVHYETSVPFGQDRLIPIWVATLALRQRSRTVRFNTAAEMLDFFRLFKDGKRYNRIMEGFQRIFAATIFFGTTDQPRAKLLLDWARFHFFDRLHLWFYRNEPATVSAPNAENLMVLSEAFYE